MFSRLSTRCLRFSACCFFLLVLTNGAYLIGANRTWARSMLILGGEPMLKIPERISATQNATVDVPIEFSGNGATIAGLLFSIDFDEGCLLFDDSDANNDGVPDDISFNLPPQFDPGVTFNQSETNGELDVIIADFQPPLASLSDDTIATIQFTTTCEPEPGASIIAPVAFSDQPSPSFSDQNGGSVPGSTSDGSVEIVYVTPTSTPIASATAVSTGSATPTAVSTGSATPTAVSTGSATPTAMSTGSATPTASATGSTTPSPTPASENYYLPIVNEAFTPPNPG